MSDPLEKAEEGKPDRSAKGRFLPGHKLAGPGNAGARINVAALARRKAKEMGLDLDGLLWDVAFAMLVLGSCGNVKAAKLAYEMLGEQEVKGPLINIDARSRVPEAPPLSKAGADGAPPLGEHLRLLALIAKERGLVDLAELVDVHPVDVVATIINRSAVEELLS